MMRDFFKTIFLAVLAVGPLAAAINRPVRVDGGLVSGVPGKDPIDHDLQRDSFCRAAGWGPALAPAEPGFALARCAPGGQVFGQLHSECGG